ncbi:MAG TPA: hypothetical protein GXX51_03370 [Firmicutes bacterium]|nr:hypothetical protein [Bacillota bacterium]
MSGENELRSTFIRPSHEYGPTSFWFLNNDLNSDDLSWSLQEQRKKGFAGVFMHPRTGLEVEYLSEAFWKGIRHSIKEASRLGMKAWMYDEYNWPSGPVGGRLLREHPEYREVFLDYRVYRVEAGETLRVSLPEGTHPLAATAVPDGEGQAVISGVVDLTGYIGPDNILTWTAPERASTMAGQTRTAPWHAELGTPAPPPSPLAAGAWDVAIFFTGINDEQFFCTANAPWTRAERGYLDLMNPEAVSKFLELTHEEYAKRFGEHFGKTIPGVFTDEPGHYRSMPWTGRFLDEFQRRKGYDLRPHLYKLALPAGDYVRIRCDYHEVATALYIEAFYRQVRLWCEEHGLEFTGHPIWEEDLFLMPVAHGSIAFVWREMHMPGIDYLGDAGPYDKSNVYETKNLAPKLLASVAHQLGKKRILCEIFGGNGWATDLAGYKKVVNWALATGINFFNPHAVHVSLKGLRKRDFPASHFVQQPWWEYYERLSNYIARGSYINTHTEHVADIAVLFPTFTLWAEHTLHDKTPFMRQVKRAIIDLADALLRIQRDYDFIFDEMLSEASSYEDGGDSSAPRAGQPGQVVGDFVMRVKVDPGVKVYPACTDTGTEIAGPALVVGEESFRAVIIPPASTISREAARLLKEFYEVGGLVIFIGAVPVNSPQQAPDPEVVEMMKGIFGYDLAIDLGPGSGARFAAGSPGPSIRQSPDGGRAVFVPLPGSPAGADTGASGDASGGASGGAGRGTGESGSLSESLVGWRDDLEVTLRDVLGRFLPADLVVENRVMPEKHRSCTDTGGVSDSACSAGYDTGGGRVRGGVSRHGKGEFEAELMYSHRRAGDLDLYFIANLGQRRQDVALRFRARAGGRDIVEVWDPSSGEIYEVPVDRDGAISFRFEPFEAFYFVMRRGGVASSINYGTIGNCGATDDDAHGGRDMDVEALAYERVPLRREFAPGQERAGNENVGNEVVLRDEWDIELERPNMLLLEPWTLQVEGDGEVFPSRYESLEELAKSWHTGEAGESAHRRRHREMDYFMDEAAIVPPGAYYTGVARFNLDLDVQPDMRPGTDTRPHIRPGVRPAGAGEASLALVYEDLGEPVKIEINGRDVTGDAEPIFIWDRCNRAIKLGSHVRRGINEVRIRTRMPAWPSQRPNKHGFEPVVLLGDFMVKVDGAGSCDCAGPYGDTRTRRHEDARSYLGRTLVKLASSMKSGSWTENGLPNYVGAVIYRQRFVLPGAWFEHGYDHGCELFLEFEDVRSTAEVTINGHKLPALVWPPYRVNISGAVRPGENEIEVRVTNTIANLLATPRPAGILGAVKVIPYRR